MTRKKPRTIISVPTRRYHAIIIKQINLMGSKNSEFGRLRIKFGYKARKISGLPNRDGTSHD
jgi:hypothetical protein